LKKLLAILVIITSCGTASKKFGSEHPHFFACNMWIDRNKDGIYDAYEFENIKDTFHSSERVLFVAFLKNLPAGSEVTFRLFAPDGSLFHEFTQLQVFKATLYRSEYSAGDLISQKSTGVWVGVWEVEGEEIAETDVYLIY
jgi:hypothetical protein